MIRKAKKDDCKIVIDLLAIAMQDMIYKISASDNYDEAIKVLYSYYLAENNRLSYQNIYVYEENNQIIAAMCFYDGKNANYLDKILNINAKMKHKTAILKECKNDFYIDSISVCAKHQNKGIASKLILYAYQIAKENNKKLSLIVDENNHKARKLYEKLGFIFSEYKKLYGHKYLYMLKA